MERPGISSRKHSESGSDYVVFSFSNENIFHDEELEFSSKTSWQALESWLNEGGVLRDSVKESSSWAERDAWSDALSSEKSTDFQGDIHKDIVSPAVEKVYAILVENVYEEGMSSAADVELELILEKHGEHILKDVMSGVWKKSWEGGKSRSIGHFLNCVINISYFVDPDFFLSYAMAALSNKDTVIREAGIAMFEAWEKKEYKPIMEGLADTGIDWLDEYKEEVIRSLG